MQHAAAALRVGVLETRAKRIARCRFEDERRADSSLLDLRFGRRVARVEPAHESHLEEHARARDGVLHGRDFVERERRRLLAKRRLAARCRRDHDIPMGMRRRHDHDCLDRGVVDERERIGIVPRHIELRRDLLRQRRQGIRDGDQPCFRNAAREIARVDASQPAEANQSYRESSLSRARHFTLSLVTSSSFTLTSGSGFSPRMTLTALSTATRPISDGNCATEAAIVPAAIAFFASSSASKPDDADSAGFARGGEGFDGAERHQVAAGEDAVDIRMRLQHVLKDIESLIALPVRRLRRHDGDTGRRLDGIA